MCTTTLEEFKRLEVHPPGTLSFHSSREATLLITITTIINESSSMELKVQLCLKWSGKAPEKGWTEWGVEDAETETHCDCDSVSV